VTPGSPRNWADTDRELQPVRITESNPLQRCDEPSAGQVRRAIATAIGVHGVRGCAARVAQAYGEHPETALIRMRWALTAVATAFGGSRAEPAHAPAPGHSTVPCAARTA
jgi:hypothetical protein